MFAVKEKPADKFPAQIVVDVFRLIGYVISKSCWFIRYEGRNNIPDKSSGPILIAANHQTYIDPVWICLPMRRRIRYMAIGNAFNWPFVGKLIRYLGAFPVSAEPSGTVGAMKEALKTLRAGAVLTIFPEGARSFEDGKMIPFKTGVVRIALQAGVPVLPVTISGGNLIWPQKQKYPRLFRRVTITFHPLLNIEKEDSINLRENLEIWTAKLESIIATGRKQT